MAQRQAVRQQTLAIKASAAAAAEDAKMAQFRCSERTSHLNLLHRTHLPTLSCRDSQLRPGAICLTVQQVCHVRTGGSCSGAQSHYCLQLDEQTAS